MHSTTVKTIARVLDNNGWLGRAIVCLSVGCGMQSVGYFEIDSIQAHTAGRLRRPSEQSV